MGSDLSAGVPYYGGAPGSDEVPSISAPLMVQSAQDDERVNSTWPDFETAMKANNKSYQRFVYENTQHGFHNNSTPRYNETAANLSWDRTLEFFKENLA